MPFLAVPGLDGCHYRLGKVPCLSESSIIPSDNNLLTRWDSMLPDGSINVSLFCSFSPWKHRKC